MKSQNMVAKKSSQAKDEFENAPKGSQEDQVNQETNYPNAPNR